MIILTVFFTLCAFCKYYIIYMHIMRLKYWLSTEICRDFKLNYPTCFRWCTIRNNNPDKCFLLYFDTYFKSFDFFCTLLRKRNELTIVTPFYRLYFLTDRLQKQNGSQVTHFTRQWILKRHFHPRQKNIIWS